MSYKINLRKYQKLLKEVNYLRSELEYQEEVLKSAHFDFESYHREWCANNNIDIDELNKKHKKSVDKLMPNISTHKHDQNDAIIPIKDIETKRKANKFSKIYRQLARELHPDKEKGNEKKFSKISDAYNKGEWSVLLDAASDLGILPDNFTDIFPLMREEASNLRKKIATNESTYSWLFFECDGEQACMDRVIKQFLKHLFKLEL
tara:strand:+ start:88 stop:702 length:615 start_codon:yes stop_codon:yes gene_type:complete